MAYFYNNSVFLKLEHTDYLDFQWINKKLWEKIKNILICVLKTDKSLISLEWHEGKLIIFCVNYSFKKGRPRMMTLQIRQLQSWFVFCNEKTQTSMVYIKYEHVIILLLHQNVKWIDRRQQKHLFSKNNLHQSQKNDTLLCLWLSTSTKNKQTLFYS